MEEHRLEAQRKTFTLLPALEQNGSHKDELCVECERWASVTVTTSPEPASTFRADMKLRGALARWQADMMIQTRSWGHTKNNWTCFDQTKTSPVSSFHCDITHIQNAWTLSAVCVCVTGHKWFHVQISFWTTLCQHLTQVWTDFLSFRKWMWLLIIYFTLNMAS